MSLPLNPIQAGDVIRQAFLILRTMDAQMDTDPLDNKDGLQMLNDMMAMWEAEGLASGWVPVSSVEDELLMSSNYNIALYYNLAIFLAPQYGATIDPVVLRIATNAKNLLEANQECITVRVCDYSDLPRGQGQRVGYSWRDGYYR